MSEYEKYSLEDLYKSKNRYKTRQIRMNYLLRCYEAKIQRVEPLSEEFENTISKIYATQDELINIETELTKIEIVIKDNK